MVGRDFLKNSYFKTLRNCPEKGPKVEFFVVYLRQKASVFMFFLKSAVYNFTKIGTFPKKLLFIGIVTTKMSGKNCEEALENKPQQKENEI